MRARKKKRKLRKWVKVTGTILLAMGIGGGVYAYSVYKSFNNAVDSMHQAVDRTSDKRKEPVAVAEKDPFSVLMLGVDERKGDKGRSDTMIVLTVNPKNHTVKMLSIPRDTRTKIIGKGKEDKINHAYAFGGVPMAMNTVEDFLDIPIDYYIQVNMEGFKDMVDAVGGVTVNNDLDFTQDGFHFAKGKLKLSGEKALSYTRMRYEDPRGDFGRQMRQREIIQGVIDEGASFSSLKNFAGIFDVIGKNVKTNLTFDQIVSIQKGYDVKDTTIQQMELKEEGTKINNIYYGLVSPEEKQRVQNILRAQLDL
ncbi:LytR family transcriptional regulator [Neobacillus drentensis]|uniref:polyisoprenyl-teichoic acid--peptidoglycan teichoic acid transferase TagU n=1 Tax=Neobacillus drentensis TaxID=220684 RepID=UPI002FFDBCFA